MLHVFFAFLLALTGLINPESVYVIPTLPVESIYVSEIGMFNHRDGRVDLIQDVEHPRSVSIATDLIDPKGIGYSQGKVWVADVNRVVAVDPASGREKIFPSRKFKPRPTFLNDICALEDVVYVSDTQKNVVYEIHRGKIRVLLKLKAPNGIAYDRGDNSLYIASYTRPGRVYRYKNGRIKLIYSSRDIDGTDGLAMWNQKRILFISGYLSGKVVALDLKNGKVLGRLSGLHNPADIAFDERDSTLFIPEMSAGRVSAYRVKLEK